ncbi:sialidase-like [Cucurbita pepo subsp. pepo]|uniref:sialidase-like n=1 Tax=Cucurbita pepo subsp. pepo TaxID=3664 RepID=UPI000C9D3ECE|nr:sialidase-like [Cucurbita pepo subsp. pepo]
MAGKQVAGTGLSESIAGMSKNQLHDIMSQMKTLIEQNQQQAKQILIQNPALTKALFQAQIMLGMVRPPQIPSVQPSAPQHSQPSAPQHSQPSAPQHSQPSAPQHSQPSAPQHSQPSAPQHSQPSAPQHSQPSAPQHSQPSAPQHSQPSAPQHSQPSAPQHSQPSAPQHSQPSAPQHSQPSAPQHSQPSAPQHSQPSAPQHSQPSTQTTQQPNIQQTQTSASQISLQEQTGNIQSQSAPLISLQTLQHPKGFEMPQVNSISVSQPSQIPSVPPVPPSAAQPPLLHQPPMSSASMQLQQPLQTAEIPHLPLQAPLPPHSRAPTGPNFRQHYPPQTGHNMNYQPAQPMFHSGSKFPPGIGNSFPQGQSPLPSQPPPQSLYQAGGSKVGTEVMNQVGTSKPVDRGPWMHGPPENRTLPQQLSGPPLIPSGTGQMGPGNQPRPTPPLSQEMEKMLLQQVMSLTPEQINLLPPEQRSQVHQLQKMLRQ